MLNEILLRGVNKVFQATDDLDNAIRASDIMYQEMFGRYRALLSMKRSILNNQRELMIRGTYGKLMDKVNGDIERIVFDMEGLSEATLMVIDNNYTQTNTKEGI